jgi:hypothetical protein
MRVATSRVIGWPNSRTMTIGARQSFGAHRCWTASDIEKIPSSTFEWRAEARSRANRVGARLDARKAFLARMRGAKIEGVWMGMSSLSQLNDRTLLEGLGELVRSHRRLTSALLAHLGEMDARKLHWSWGIPRCLRTASRSCISAKTRRIGASRRRERLGVILRCSRWSKRAMFRFRCSGS